MKEIFDQFSTFWKKLGPNQKAAILAVSIIAIVALSAMVMYAQRPQYTLLFGGLNAEDSAATVSYLAQNNIPYEVQGNGATVLVLREKVDEARAAITEKNLIKGGEEGFSLLDKNTLGWTDMLQQVNLTRATQGEIAKILGNFSFVNSAKVIISPNEKSLYANEEKPAKASVFLTLKPGKAPSAEQIAAVVNLVANGFPGLQKNQIVVTDQNGKLLHLPQDKGTEATTSMLASERLSYQQNMENHLSEQAQSMLDKAYGPGKAFVQVRVSVKDPPPLEERTVIDKKSAVKSETKKDRSSQSPSEGAAGDTSVLAKTENKPTTPVSSQSKETEVETQKTYYEPGKTVTRTLLLGYKIEKLFVSLFIDKALEAQKAAIEEQVKRSVGWDETRKDDPVVAAVTEVPKVEVPTPPAEGFLDKWANVQLLQYAAEFAAVLVLGFFLKGLIKKSGKGGAKGAAGAGTPGVADLPPEVIARLQSRRSTEALIVGDNEGASRVAKKWMADAKK